MDPELVQALDQLAEVAGQGPRQAGANLRYLRTGNAAAAAEQARRVAEPLGVPVVEGSVPKPPADE